MLPLFFFKFSRLFLNRLSQLNLAVATNFSVDIFNKTINLIR